MLLCPGKQNRRSIAKVQICRGRLASKNPFLEYVWTLKTDELDSYITCTLMGHYVAMNTTNGPMALFQTLWDDEEVEGLLAGNRLRIRDLSHGLLLQGRISEH